MKPSQSAKRGVTGKTGPIPRGMPEGCERCEDLPAPLQLGTLFIAPPPGHALTKLESLVKRLELEPAQAPRGVIGVVLGQGDARRLAVSLSGALSRLELSDGKSLMLPSGGLPSLDDLFRFESLRTFVARASGDWVVDMLREGRIETHFQPIVSFAKPTEPFAYEALLRGLEPDGSLISPTAIFQAARDANVIFQVDRSARLACIAAVVAKHVETNVFVNFTPNSVYDPSFCLRTTVSAVASAGLDPSRFVFEVTESDQVEDVDHLLGILSFYRRNGFRVALDDLGAGYSSLNLLARLRPDFVKLDMQLIRGIDLDPYKAVVVEKLLELARDVGATSVVEGVETEGEWRWARDHGADLAQGFLCARPAALPPLPFSDQPFPRN
ncbi:MAG: EAL domain-containing protein [Vicinamibacteria bacterium]